MEMLKPVHALLAIMAVPLMLRHPPLPLSLLSAHAPPTPTEMVPPAQTALITLQDPLVVLVVLESLPKLLAIARPTSMEMPELLPVQLVLPVILLLLKRMPLPLSLETALLPSQSLWVIPARACLCPVRQVRTAWIAQLWVIALPFQLVPMQYSTAQPEPGQQEFQLLLVTR